MPDGDIEPDAGAEHAGAMENETRGSPGMTPPRRATSMVSIHNIGKYRNN
jgi:hypothetical protein